MASVKFYKALYIFVTDRPNFKLKYNNSKDYDKKGSVHTDGDKIFFIFNKKSFLDILLKIITQLKVCIVTIKNLKKTSTDINNFHLNI